MIEPCGPRLAVKAYKQVEVDEVLSKAKASGFLDKFEIINTNSKREDASVDKGIVLSIGPTCWNLPEHGKKAWCKVGDEIIFAKFSGKVVTDPDTNEDIFIINDDDVVAVIREGKSNGR